MENFKKIREFASWALGPTHRVKLRVAAELREGEIELTLLPLLADRNCDFLDVGANVGIYAYYGLSYFRTVYAVEANPGLVGPLKRILEPKGKVVAAALSDQAGTATLCIPVRDRHDIDTRSSLQADANPEYELREVEVAVTTIDKLGLDRIGLIKVDVEGHEFAVLRGATETLAKAKPLCIVECEERHNPGGVARLFLFFRELGFNPYFLHRGRLRHGAEFDPAVLQDRAQAKQVNDLRSPDYINNFIFVHPANAEGLQQIRRQFG